MTSPESPHQNERCQENGVDRERTQRPRNGTKAVLMKPHLVERTVRSRMVTQKIATTREQDRAPGRSVSKFAAEKRQSRTQTIIDSHMITQRRRRPRRKTVEMDAASLSE